jgi:hypothetical protein
MRTGTNRNSLRESYETRDILWVKCRDFNVEADGTYGNRTIRSCGKRKLQCLLCSRTKWEFVTGAEVQGTESYVEGKPKHHSFLTLRPQHYRNEVRSLTNHLRYND